MNRMSLTIQLLHNEPLKYGCCPTIFMFEDIQPRQIISMSIVPSFTLFKSSGIVMFYSTFLMQVKEGTSG
jgi:hypothetical protein